MLPLKVSFWFVVITAVFVTCLITANIIAVKLILLFGFLVLAGILVFPLSYLFGDVLTEVYGAARQVIWLDFSCNWPLSMNGLHRVRPMLLAQRVPEVGGLSALR